MQQLEDIEKIKNMNFKPEQLEMLARMLKDGKMPTINRSMKRQHEKKERTKQTVPIDRSTKLRNRLKAKLEKKKEQENLNKPLD